jgi:glycine N-methyltransferase
MKQFKFVEVDYLNLNFEYKIEILQSKHLQQIVTSVLYTNGMPSLITLEYRINLNIHENNGEENVSEFRLSYYPHMLKVFSDFLNNAFHDRAKHSIYGDFKPLEEAKDPGFYIHVLEKNQ